MNESFLQEHNIIFGILFTILGSYLFIKNGKEMIYGYIDKEYWGLSYSIGLFAGGGIFLALGIILLFFKYPFE